MRADTSSPIFVIGRQHSGNTMLAVSLGRLPDVFGMVGEGTFFEQLPALIRLHPLRRAEEIVNIIHRATQSELSPAVCEELRTELSRKLVVPEARRRYSAVSAYAHAMDFLAKKHGKKRWAQKATSCVFYVDTIVKSFPGARLIFLLRNPLDLAASLKRRSGSRLWFRMIWGWNKGVLLADRYRQRYERNLLVVRYEDLVEEPEVILRHVCQFAGLDFGHEMLDIPHVNPAESPHVLHSQQRGISQSRRFWYPHVLEPEEEGAIRALVSPELLRRHYSDLPVPRECSSRARLSTVLKLCVRGLWGVVADHLKRLARGPRHSVDRICRRLL